MKNKTNHIGIIAIIACLLAIGMFSLIGCETIRDFEKDGDRNFEQGNYERAVYWYNYVLQEYPGYTRTKTVQEKLAKARAAKLDQEREAQKPQRVKPVTEADLEYVQNRQGGITITGYKEFQEGKAVIRDLVIPAQIQGINVTEIADFAFQNGYYRFSSNQGRFNKRDRDVFENVTIPSTVTSIGNQAFIGRGIKTLNLPEGLRAIGAGAFAENQISSNVKWPSAITVIPITVFAHNQLTSIDIPSSVTTIESGAFGGNKLTELTIPANVTRISACAFADNMISKLTFSNSGKLKTIEATAFSKNNLKSVALPEGLTEIITQMTTVFGDTDFGTIRHNQFIMSLSNFFGVSTDDGILSDNPLSYIKIPSTLVYNDFNDAFFKGSRLVSVIERVKPRVTVIQGDTIDAVKLGEDNMNFALDTSFNNFYALQGKKAGIYMRRGQLWAMGTQAEFDALIAEKTK